ncbi:hypothetical protein Bsp3421_003968 [Burkholderia sp. FERM BP-3421]|uniref:hypothetical protein n=1 Tax=Burkholderia sp. FERM BP-3421 TaxID=1494466 RepID=UPI00235F2ED7|nr:hypothetical protein [Burkholderia sp. FERM BP-3421]WDD93867.1 hypothetical protein Bsp3421_003968 [Burkholderia sp. FERM BP-3421]
MSGDQTCGPEHASTNVYENDLKDIILKAFVASAMVDLLGMEDDPASQDVQAFMTTHPKVEKEITAALEAPGMEETFKEYARDAARTALVALKEHVGEAA